MSTALTSLDVRPEVVDASGEPTTGSTVTRLLLAGVALAAGIIGVAMVLVPGSTGRYFSWALDPPALAALVGACYIASAVVFGWAAFRQGWTGQRGLCVAVLGLAGPTLVATARHHAVFDFDRWQAVAWVALFTASVTSFGSLVVHRPRRPATDGPLLGRDAQALLLVLAGGYGVAAAVLWIDPVWVSTHGPITAGPLGLRFMGSWAAFLAIGATYAATHRRWAEARMNVVALVIFPAAALVATMLHADELRTDTSTIAYVAVLGLLSALAGLALLSVPGGPVRPSTHRRRSDGSAAAVG